MGKENIRKVEIVDQLLSGLPVISPRARINSVGLPWDSYDCVLAPDKLLYAIRYGSAVNAARCCKVRSATLTSLTLSAVVNGLMGLETDGTNLYGVEFVSNGRFLKFSGTNYTTVSVANNLNRYLFDLIFDAAASWNGNTNTMYIVDYSNNKILKGTGTDYATIVDFLTGLYAPRKLALDGKGKMFILERGGTTESPAIVEVDIKTATILKRRYIGGVNPDYEFYMFAYNSRLDLFALEEYLEVYLLRFGGGERPPWVAIQHPKPGYTIYPANGFWLDDETLVFTSSGYPYFNYLTLAADKIDIKIKEAFENAIKTESVQVHSYQFNPVIIANYIGNYLETGFWNNASVSAGGESAAVEMRIYGTISDKYVGCLVTVYASAATTITVLTAYASAGNYYDLATFDVAAGQRKAFYVEKPGKFMKLRSSAAATITAGYTMYHF